MSQTKAELVNGLSINSALADAVTIDSSGRVLAGTSSSRNVGGSTTNSKLQIEGTSTNTSSMSLVNNENSTAAPFVFFGKTRGNSAGESGIVQSGDTLGGLSFIGADSVDTNNRTAEITAVVNGSPANNTIPTDLIFSTSTANAGQLAERLRIDSNGRVQKGSASNNLGLASFNIVDGNGHSINLSRNQGAGANDDQRIGAIAFHGGLGSQSTATGGAVIEAFADENQTGSTAATRLSFATKPTGVSPGSAPTERFRINSTGVVQIVSQRMAMGTSVTNGGTSDGNFCIEFTGNTRNGMKTRDTDNTGTVNHFVLVSGSAACGTITTSTGQAFFNNLSDYRSKENDVKITDGIEKIKLLRPIRFNYKVDKDTLCDGFFAHEVAAAVPTAVQGEKDAVDSEGEIAPQMLDTGKIIPLLTAALQEEIAKREALETRVAALEAA